MTHSDDAQTTRSVVDRWCQTFSVGNYPLCKSLARDVLRRTSLEAREDDYLHGRKSMVQSLHFLGEHDAARAFAEETWARAGRMIDTTMVHPRASMGVVLARIAFMQGDLETCARMLTIARDLTRDSSAIAYCQMLALAAAPIAFWSANEGKARESVEQLRAISEANRFNYWSSWAHNLGIALELVFGNKGPGDPVGIDFQTLDGKQADLLATLDDRLISDLAITRVANGMVGWTKSEVLRIQAVSTSWYDPQAAQRLLRNARGTAQTMGVVAWDNRLAQAHAEIGARRRRADVLVPTRMPLRSRSPG